MSGSSAASPNTPKTGSNIDPLDDPVAKHRLSFDFSDSVSTISIFRQYETYSSPQMNEASDLFTLNPNGSEIIRTKLGEVLVTNAGDERYEFWRQVIEDYAQFISKTRTVELELRVIEGIPDDLRELVYAKVLQIRYRFNNKESYQNLVKRARQSTSNKSQESYIDRLAVDSSLKEVLKTFSFYINEIVGVSNRLEVDGSGTFANDSNEKLPPNSFVIHVSKLLENLGGMEKQDTLFLLLKLNRLFTNLIKEEFFYKVNRSLEDLVPEAFTHTSVQGINLVTLYKSILFNFFNTKIDDSQVLLKVLDFVIIEGFDFVLRLVLWAFDKNKDKILQLKGDELNEFLNSKSFFSLDFQWIDIINQQPQIVKYENEYHLIHANSLNNNNNELRNLREVNDDLVIKINEINHQLDNLQTTHSEILDQSESFQGQLDEALARNEQLGELKAQLQAKYEGLTMKENLKNTIKANKEFSERNRDLELQIEALKKLIEEKRLKVAKVAGN
ncbi:uncharacterized protein CANTADRAFT_87457 [Suhomyces tanzawaensis NRRL Y-17324]|uniref:Rab-GAP TBC domain-containing protein n=1 Tax=Suhomyces tanzawaensis NRRL Y-17324 TaxID=984487 RepID=A0A1E4SPW2_9ASCO|nr:uncharacterized protein CANTADRAFT_87457 [Suhomyces tanzawaensis NRRL Y-17324]ODV81467.1 hypothetical protein CANTADRAFT_87457 [Suhomyces tanzawaensis NRRL Y-17324]